MGRPECGGPPRGAQPVNRGATWRAAQRRNVSTWVRALVCADALKVTLALIRCTPDGSVEERTE
jgi:hypothetical protein